MINQVSYKTTKEKLFTDFYLSEGTLKSIEKLGYKQPTQVQARTIPLIMAGIDLIVMSQTGTGKTAAFAIPTVEIMIPVPGQIDLLVLTPTRELAIQVGQEFERVGTSKNLKVATIYGGSSYEKQYEAIADASVVVATPGRLVDLIESKKIDLSGLKHFILDEADEMLSMGFAEDLDKIIDHLPEARQSLLFSATITNEVKSLAKRLLFYPEFVTMEADSRASTDVTHVWYRVDPMERSRELLRLLDYEQPEQAILFANTKQDTVTITENLVAHGFKAAHINGDLPQKDRERVLSSFRKEDIQILVATDVAARGIDITGLTHVFNYVVPENAESYIHRAGRTGRAGLKGRAVSLVSPAEFPTLHAVKKHYDITPIEAKLPTTKEIIEAKRKNVVSQVIEDLSENLKTPSGPNLSLAKGLLETTEDREAVEKLISRLILFYQDHQDDKAAPAVQEPVVTESVKEASSLGKEVGEMDKSEAEYLAPTPTPRPIPNTSRERRSGSRNGRDAGRRNGKSEETTLSSGRRSRVPESQRSNSNDTNRRHDRGIDRRTEEAEKTTGRRRRRRRGQDDLPVSTTRPSSLLERTTSIPQELTPVQDKPSNGNQSSDKSRNGSSRRRHRRHQDDRRESSRRRKEQPQEEYVSTKNAHLPFEKEEFDYKKMWINLGGQQIKDKQTLLETIIDLSGFGAEDFGDITVEPTFSYVDVRADYFDDIVYTLNEQQLKGHYIAVEAARK